MNKTVTFLTGLLKAFRGLLVAAVIVAIVLPVIAYIMLSSGWAHKQIREVGEKELTELLGTEVSIGDVKFRPFNRLLIKDISVLDDNDSTALTVKEIATRVEMWDFLFKQKIIIDYADIKGLNLKLYKDSVNAPLNIANIVEKLSKKEPDKEETKFKLRLNDLSLNECSMSYDVWDQPATPGVFNASHIKIDSLWLGVFAPVISNDDYTVRLRELRFVEQSGFRLDNLTLNGRLTPQSVEANDLSIILPGSQIDFGPIKAEIQGFKDLANIAVSEPLNISIQDGSHLYIPDIKAFSPLLGNIDYNIGISTDIAATRNNVDIENLLLQDLDGIFKTEVQGTVSDFKSIETLNLQDLRLSLQTDTMIINDVLKSANAKLSPKAINLISHLGNTSIECEANGSLSQGEMDISVNSRLADIALKGIFSKAGSETYSVDCVTDIDSLKLGILTGNEDLNNLAAHAELKGKLGKKSFSGTASADIDFVDFKGYRYHDINASGTFDPRHVTADLRVMDPNVNALFLGDWWQEDNTHSLKADLAVTKLRLDTLNLSKVYPGYNLSGAARVEAIGQTIDRFRGNLELSNLALRDAAGKGVAIRNLDVSADNIDRKGRIVVESDIINGVVDGDYKFTTLGHDITSMLHSLLPALILDEDENKPKLVEKDNNFAFDFTIEAREDICDFFNLPVTLVNAVNINGYFRDDNGTFNLMCDAPWLGFGNSYIEDPDLVVHLDSQNGTGDAFFVARTPTKKGDMDLSARINISDGALDTDILWTLIREKPINGNIAFLTKFARDEHNHLETQVNFNPGKINFGNEIWRIRKSQITYVHDSAVINNFSLITDESESESQNLASNVLSENQLSSDILPILSDGVQAVTINGRLGTEDEDKLTVDLHNIQLINIFETLDIDKALISGYATGTIHGEALLSKNPIINCDALRIKSIGYNYCTLGDAVAKLSFDDGGSVFNFAATVNQPGGQVSYLDGFIIPATETLDLNINADYIKVGFMKPFMEAFTSDVSGYASGKAKLYGTFKDIDMTGDIYVDSLAIKIDFTNTWYHANDSIHIEPGIIKLNDIRLTDDYGNTAMLNGWVAHEFFHNASFDFSVTDAKNLLCYDVSEKLSPIWYGRIFGDGSATVKGHPGIVDIKARISTGENSTFTFVLSDQEEADEYSFITFRDVTPHAPNDTILNRDTTPERILMAMNKNKNQSVDEPTNYTIDLEVDVDPDAQIIIVMDPIGGDRIRSNGAGNMRMQYTSVDNDLRLYGKYTLEKGSYNFTLQDIIRKDFTIKEGSTIDFSGDPYNAQLDIDAYAQINANLSDLDESFLQDKELNRTNVPVRAMLLVRGDMLQPSISFDLEFPTLTQDTYRKVKSIVSTEDMMSKQIIYLLALNRFYTPEYMASTTKGNELFSVASSTLASQLSNMLGKLSDNWSIAPNLRSDRGDFSDIEVDLTLSSSLLNNRLLFNGNFGYRDKSLNTNQFIGDFDLEYLLNKSGVWRLKAYNRYNDQNYYLRTAQTTQGVGLVYRKDFDMPFKFLRHLRKGPDEENKNPTDTIIETLEIQETIVPDTIK